MLSDGGRGDKPQALSSAVNAFNRVFLMSLLCMDLSLGRLEWYTERHMQSLHVYMWDIKHLLLSVF